MDIRFQHSKAWQAECTIAFALEEESGEALAPSLWQMASWLSIAPALRDCKGKKGEQHILYGHPDMAVSRVMLVGLGKREELSLQELRLALATAVKICRDKGFETVGIAMESLSILAGLMDISAETIIAEIVVATSLGLYRCDVYKGDKKTDEPKNLRWLALFLSGNETPDSFFMAARQAEAEAGGVIKARNLVNGPANYITPAFLAEESQAMAKRYGFACTVYSGEEIRDMGMGALWGVGKGSAEDPKFIILEFCPKGKEKDDPFVVVGKGITFDTGGISLKPAANMHEMKGDMAGGGAVLGFFEALGQMPDTSELPRIIGLLPAAENMPGGRATRPGDILTTLSGKTVEILNTDAEGRLILCDALTYAQKNWKPKALVNIATLTGACVIALGDDAAAVFTEDKWLRKNTLDAAEELGELFWPLPLWDAYDKKLESAVADIPNIGPREGGALHAALFLRRFIEKGTPWAHLDIAGPGYVVKTNPLHPVSGGTGEGVRLFCSLARKVASRK